MQQDQTIGAIKVNRMIWTATLLSLGSIFYCWLTCDKHNPSIMASALEYPNMIILRVGLMYSLFILFLVNFFIKWWVDSSQRAHHTWKTLLCGLLSLAAYALWVSTLDRARINYTLAEWAVFVACIANFVNITDIFRNIKVIRQADPHFISAKSYKMKKIIYSIYASFMTTGLLIYLGQLDIDLKNAVEYGVVVSSYLFYWSFTYDFKKFTMDIDKFVTIASHQNSA